MLLFFFWVVARTILYSVMHCFFNLVRIIIEDGVLFFKRKISASIDEGGGNVTCLFLIGKCFFICYLLN